MIIESRVLASVSGGFDSVGRIRPQGAQFLFPTDNVALLKLRRSPCEAMLPMLSCLISLGRQPKIVGKLVAKAC